MQRSVVKIDHKTEKSKLERWNKIAESAAKQSKRDRIPQVLNVLSINELEEVIRQNNYTDVLVLYEKEIDKEEDNINTIKTHFSKDSINNNIEKRKIAIVIGPEGGITEKEIGILETIGGVTISLGRRILRTETASIMMLSILQYIFDM